MPVPYEAFHRGPVRGYCHSSLLPHLDFFADDFEEKIKGQIRTVYLERPNWVVAARLPFNDLPSTTVLIKRFGRRSCFHWLLSSWTESRALRAFRMAMTVQKAGIQTPQPLIAWERRRFGFVRHCYSITAWIPEACSARQFLRALPPESPQVTALLASLAQATRRLHDTGILHRDLTLGNFLLDPDRPDRVYLVDLSRSFVFRSLPLILRLVDLARMNFGPLWPDFYRLYCQDRPDWPQYERLLKILVRLRRASIAFRKIKKLVGLGSNYFSRGLQGPGHGAME